jgi:membrane-associated phospholipid phosphatase
MPSGHAQAVWFIVFYNLNKTNERITALLCVLALATCIQRIYTERHTLEQVIVGSFIGSMLGFMASKI